MDLPEGYSLKAPELADVPAIAETLAAGDTYFNGSPDTDENDIKDDWVYEGFDPSTDSWMVVGPNGRVAGYAAVFKKNPGETLEAYGGVHPEERGRGVGSTLVRLIEERATSYMSEVDVNEIVVQHHVIGVDTAGIELFTAMDHEVIRHTWLMAIELDDDLREFPCPDGVEVRAFRSGEERALHAMEQEAFQDHWQFNPESYEVWLRRSRESEAFDPELWLVATVGDRLVGASLSYVHAESGYVDSLSVLREWRGKGVAAHLLGRSFRLLQERGLSRATLHVDALNPTGATRLYERVGMHVDRVYDLYARRVSRPH